MNSHSSPPHRIAFCITDLDVGGAERALVQLVTRLDRGFWEPHVICLSQEGELVKELEAAHIPTFCLGARTRKNLTVYFRLAKCLKNIQPKILQTYLYHANIMGRFAARKAGVPHTVSGIRVAERRGKLRLWVDRLTQGSVAHHVCVSKDVAEFSIQSSGLHTDKVVVIPNGVDTERFSQAQAVDLSQFGIPEGAKTVLFVGRLDRQKGPFILLAAVKGILQAHDNVHVLFVGDGPLRNPLHDWVREHNLAANIHFAGQQREIESFYQAADCLVLPSRWEGMPNVVLEAMAAGKPVITTTVEGTRDLISNHVNGLLIPPESPQELAAKLTMLLTDPDQAANLGKAAQTHIQKEFTWENTVKKYDRLYRSLLSD